MVSAEVLCPDCNRWHSLATLWFHEPTLELVCQGCARQRRRGRRFQARRLFLNPAFYVLAGMLAAVAAYGLGQGRWNAAGRLAAEHGTPWHLRSRPKQWLQQAERTRMRAAFLRNRGREVEARSWSALAAEAFARAATAWNSAPVEPELWIANALMCARAGDVMSAKQTLQRLEAQHAQDAEMLTRIHYFRIRLLADAGRQAEWTPLVTGFLDEARPLAAADDFGAAVDRLVAAAARDRLEQLVHMRVRAVCGTGVPWRTMVDDVCALRDHAAGAARNAQVEAQPKAREMLRETSPPAIRVRRYDD